MSRFIYWYIDHAGHMLLFGMIFLVALAIITRLLGAW